MGQAVAFSIVGGADAELFAIDALTRELRFLAAPNFESPADADRDTVYPLIVAANDGKRCMDTQALSVNVHVVPEGFAQGTSEWRPGAKREVSKGRSR